MGAPLGETDIKNLEGSSPCLKCLLLKFAHRICNCCAIRSCKKERGLKPDTPPFVVGSTIAIRSCKKERGLKRQKHYGTGSGIHGYRDKALALSFTCCDCNENRLYLLLVHHIDGDRNNNNVSNLEVVCGTCHMKRHLKLVDGKWRYNSRVLTPRECLKSLGFGTAGSGRCTCNAD